MSLGSRAFHAVRHDIGRKLTALCLAIGVWFVLEGVVLDEQSEVLEVVPVTSVEEADRDRLTANRSTIYLVVPDTLQVQNWVPQSPRLRVKGLKEDVRGLVMSAVVEFDEDDLEGQDTAAVERTLGRENFKGRDRSPELTLFRIGKDASATLIVTLVRRTSLSLELRPVNVSVAGEPAKGYAFDGAGARTRPTVVTVSGPGPVVEQFRAEPGLLKLAPVSVEGRNSTVIQAVGLSPDLIAQRVSLSPASIDVTVPISPKDKDVRLVAIPITYKNEAALAELGFELVAPPPATRDVVVLGPAPELDRYTQEQLAQLIDLVFDYRSAILVDGINTGTLDFFRGGDLSQAVKVYGEKGAEPRIEFKLQEVQQGP